jgi:PPOX class probable F420-dependent enzyme
MAAMTDEQRDTFLREPRIAVLATLSEDGSPTGIAIWFEWDGKQARMFTTRNSPKLRRIEADPRVSLTVAEPTGVPEAWVTIEGEARIADGGFALAQRLAPRYYPPEQAQQALASWGAEAERWVVIEVTPRRIRSLAPS